MNAVAHRKALFASEAVIPIRSSPSESAEMVSQLLFGDFCEVLEQDASWTRVQVATDAYVGWVDSKMLVPIAEEELSSVSEHLFVLEGAILLEDQSLLRLPRGAGIPRKKSDALDALQVGTSQWKWDKRLRLSPQLDRSHLKEVAMGFLNTPYLWGGCSGYGIDCSGLTQRSFRMCGIQLPRDSSQQAKIGESIAFGDHREGDLAFFSKPKQDHITHVGLIVGPTSIIHASGRVRIDTLTEKGIWHEETQGFTHQLITIQRC